MCRAAEDLAAARAEVASAQTQLSEAKASDMHAPAAIAALCAHTAKVTPTPTAQAANASLAERLEEAQGDAARAYEALRYSSPLVGVGFSVREQPTI